VEVRQVGDPQSVELGREPRNGQVEDPQPDPPRLERAPAEPRERERAGGGAELALRGQASIFSSIGCTETTCRLNLSSDSCSPAATPTSCDR
jgi:hypothetical protein